MGCLHTNTEVCNVLVNVRPGCGNKPARCAFTPHEAAAVIAGCVDYRIEAVTRSVLIDVAAQSQSGNIKPSVDFWLVCSVNLDQDVALLVLGGNVITVDGKFVYVLKT